jgi:hypothetical protein
MSAIHEKVAALATELPLEAELKYVQFSDEASPRLVCARVLSTEEHLLAL